MSVTQLSVLIWIIFNIELTHLGSEASIYNLKGKVAQMQYNMNWSYAALPSIFPFIFISIIS